MTADFKDAHRHPRGAPHQLPRSLLSPRRQPETAQRVVAVAFSPKPVLFVPRRQRSALHNVVAAKLAKDKTSPELVIRCRLATQLRTT